MTTSDWKWTAVVIAAWGWIQGPSSLPVPCWGERRMPLHGAELPCIKRTDGVLNSRSEYRRTKGVDLKSPRPVCPRMHSLPFCFSGPCWAEWELTPEAVSQAPSRGPGEGQRERSQGIYPLPLPAGSGDVSQQPARRNSLLALGLLCPHFLWARCSERLLSLAFQLKGGNGFQLLLIYELP